MKTQTNILVITAQLVVVVGMGLTLMSCGDRRFIVRDREA